MRKFISENRSEIFILTLVLFGLFLLFELDPGNLYSKTTNAVLNLMHLTRSAVDAAMPDFARRASMPELIGATLLLVAVLISAWRIRDRFLKSLYWRSKVCPRCGSTLERVHRSQLDRLVGRFLLPHAHRYRCSNSSCRWSGLRHRDHHPHGSQAERGDQQAI
jgi:hypothetical protein